MVAALGAGVAKADEEFVGLQDGLAWTRGRALVCHKNKGEGRLKRLFDTH
jgi:hypothetical protein